MSYPHLMRVIDLMIADNFPTSTSRDAAKRRCKQLLKSETPSVLARAESQAAKLSDEEKETFAGGEDLEIEGLDAELALGALNALIGDLFEEL